MTTGKETLYAYNCRSEGRNPLAVNQDQGGVGIVHRAVQCFCWKDHRGAILFDCAEAMEVGNQLQERVGPFQLS